MFGNVFFSTICLRISRSVKTPKGSPSSVLTIRFPIPRLAINLMHSGRDTSGKTEIGYAVI